jgi:hypothetical protein
MKPFAVKVWLLAQILRPISSPCDCPPHWQVSPQQILNLIDYFKSFNYL